MDIIQLALLSTNTAGILYLLHKTQSKSESRSTAVILDSCALIDGRIKDVIGNSFITGDIIVPQFVLRELQQLADGNDTHKRARARVGLELSEELRSLYPKRFSVDTSIKLADKTDEQLITLAKKLKARLCTTDYNLNKVAATEGIIVLNVNELARALRPTFLPGDEVEVKLLQKGEGRGQAVGYLDDGTMVVVDNGMKYIGARQTVVIERSLQTVAGKMSFAHLKTKQK